MTIKPSQALNETDADYLERRSMPSFPSFDTASRADRRRILKDEKRERESGKWSIFKKFAMPPGSIAGNPAGWLQDVHTVHTNGWLCVMQRTCRTRVGYVEHAAIRTASQTDLSWSEKQRIKDALFGAITTAVEVFPARDWLIDAANMYHLWVFPMDYDLPFGLASSDECSSQHFRP